MFPHEVNDMTLIEIKRILEKIGFDATLRILTIILNEEILEARKKGLVGTERLNMHRVEKLRELIDPTVKPTLEDISNKIKTT